MSQPRMSSFERKLRGRIIEIKNASTDQLHEDLKTESIEVATTNACHLIIDDYGHKPWCAPQEELAVLAGAMSAIMAAFTNPLSKDRKELAIHRVALEKEMDLSDEMRKDADRAVTVIIELMGMTSIIASAEMILRLEKLADIIRKQVQCVADSKASAANKVVANHVLDIVDRGKYKKPRNIVEGLDELIDRCEKSGITLGVKRGK